MADTYKQAETESTQNGLTVRDVATVLIGDTTTSASIGIETTFVNPVTGSISEKTQSNVYVTTFADRALIITNGVNRQIGLADARAFGQEISEIAKDGNVTVAERNRGLLLAEDLKDNGQLDGSFKPQEGLPISPKPPGGRVY